MVNVFSMGTVLYYGKGALKELPGQLFALNAKPKVIVCTDEGINKTGIVKKLLEILTSDNVDSKVFSKVTPNPRIGTVQEGLGMMNEFGANMIIGLGGGSSIDTAKAIAALHSNDGDLRDFRGRGLLKNPTVPLIAIPTTYGTGSEANKATLITDETKKEKMIIVSQFLQPVLAFIDPELMVQLPPKIAASTAIDALTHAVESYTSLGAQHVTDALNVYAIKLIIENAPLAVVSNVNEEATSKVAIASTIAGMAFGNTSLALVHAIAHALGGFYDVAHGEANAILLPHVMRYNLPAVPEKYKKIGTLFDWQLEGLPVLEGAEEACQRVENFRDLLEAPKSLRSIGVQKKDLEKIAELAAKDGNFAKNPRQATKPDVVGILEKAF